ncbi:MAG: tyrosine-type recombinase/integrase [Flavobacteriales bacterium]
MKNNNKEKKWFQRMVSTLFYLRGAKKNRQTGATPIYLRITINGNRSDLSTKQWILPSQWDSKAQKAKGNKEEAQILNCFLSSKSNEVRKHYNTLQLAGKTATPEMIVNLLKGIGEKQYTLIEAYELHNKDFKEQVSIGKVSESRLEKHEIALRMLKAFISFRFLTKDIALNDLSTTIIGDFEYFLRTEYKHQFNTAIGYCKALKKILSMAYRNKWLNNNLSEHWNGVFKDTQRPFLNSEELLKLEQENLSNPSLSLVRDVFVFSCYTALAFADVSKLQSSEIIRGIDGKYWIVTNRKKTDEKINLPLLPEAKRIVEKYKNHPISIEKNKIFPIYSHQTTNDYLKKIAALCGINKEISYHAARHKFATTVALANGVPIETVSEILSHRDLKTTKIYAKIGNAKIQNDMAQLEKKLKKGKALSKKIKIIKLAS